MSDTINVRELRNHGGRVLDRVEAGETLVVTRGGRPVAELRPLEPAPITTAELQGRLTGIAAAFGDLRAELDELFAGDVDDAIDRWER